MVADTKALHSYGYLLAICYKVEWTGPSMPDEPFSKQLEVDMAGINVLFLSKEIYNEAIHRLYVQGQFILGFDISFPRNHQSNMRLPAKGLVSVTADIVITIDLTMAPFMTVTEIEKFFSMLENSKMVEKLYSNKTIRSRIHITFTNCSTARVIGRISSLRWMKDVAKLKRFKTVLVEVHSGEAICKKYRDEGHPRYHLDDVEFGEGLESMGKALAGQLGPYEVIDRLPAMREAASRRPPREVPTE